MDAVHQMDVKRRLDKSIRMAILKSPPPHKLPRSLALLPLYKDVDRPFGSPLGIDRLISKRMAYYWRLLCSMLRLGWTL